jgi:hypothetical protein
MLSTVSVGTHTPLNFLLNFLKHFLAHKATITTAKMKFLSKTVKYTLYDKRNQDILKELKMERVLEKTIIEQHIWRVHRMDRSPTPECYYETPTRRKEDDIKETSGLLYWDRIVPQGRSPWQHDDDDDDFLKDFTPHIRFIIKHSML